MPLPPLPSLDPDQVYVVPPPAPWGPWDPYYPDDVSGKVFEHASHFCDFVKNRLLEYQFSTGRHGSVVAMLERRDLDVAWFVDRAGSLDDLTRAGLAERLRGRGFHELAEGLEPRSTSQAKNSRDFA